MRTVVVGDRLSLHHPSGQEFRHLTVTPTGTHASNRIEHQSGIPFTESLSSQCHLQLLGIVFPQTNGEHPTSICWRNIIKRRTPHKPPQPAKPAQRTPFAVKRNVLSHLGELSSTATVGRTECDQHGVHHAPRCGSQLEIQTWTFPGRRFSSQPPRFLTRHTCTFGVPQTRHPWLCTPHLPHRRVSKDIRPGPDTVGCPVWKPNGRSCGVVQPGHPDRMVLVNT